MATASCARGELAYFFNEHKFPFYLPFSIRRFNMVFIEVLRVLPHPSIHPSSHVYAVLRFDIDLIYTTKIRIAFEVSHFINFVCSLGVWYLFVVCLRAFAAKMAFWQFSVFRVFGHFYYHLNRFDHFQAEE